MCIFSIDLCFHTMSGLDFFKLQIDFLHCSKWISLNFRDYFHTICEIFGCATVWCTSFQFNFDTFSSPSATTFCAINTLEIFDNIFSSNRTYVQNQMSFNFNFNIDYSSSWISIFARVWSTYFQFNFDTSFPPSATSFWAINAFPQTSKGKH